MSIDLVGPDGKEYTLQSDDPTLLENAKKQGFRVAADIGLGDSAIDTAAAAGAGLVQGASFNLFGAGAGAAQGDEETPESAQARWKTAGDLSRLKEEHPYASGAGELVGTVLSPINKLGGAVTGGLGATTRLGRIGATGAGQAVVGSLYGAGSALNDAVLGDADLTADKLIAYMGLGGLLGFGGGAAGESLVQGGSALLPKLSKSVSGAQSTLDDIANDAAVKSMRATQGVLKGVGETGIEEAGAVARARGHLKLSPDAILESVAADRSAVAQDVLKEMGVDAGGLAHRMPQDEAQEALKRGFKAAGDRMQVVFDEADKAGATPAYSELRAAAGKVRDGLDPAEADIVEPQIQRVEKFIDQMGLHPVGSEKNSFAAINRLKSTLQEEINYKASDSATIRLRKQLVGALKDELDTQLGRQLGPKLEKEFLDAKRVYGLLARGEEALGRKTSTGTHAIEAMIEAAGHQSPNANVFRALGHAETLSASGAGRATGIGLRDIGYGLLSGQLPHIGIATTLGAKFLREHGQALIAKTADAIAKSPSLAAIAQSMATTLPQLAPKLGPYAATLTAVAAEGAPKLLATHLALAQVDPSYEATATLAGLQPEHPEAHVAALRRGHEMANVASAAKSTDDEIARHMQRVFKGSGEPHASGDVLKSQDFGEKRMRRDAPEAHDKRVSEVRELATNPEALIDRVANNSVRLGAIAPTVSSAMAARAQAAVQYLAKSSLVPQKPGPLAREWVTAEAERHEFAQRLEVVQEPLAVMRHAAAGTLTPIQVQALREVYPRLADAVAEQTLARIAENPKSVPYSARMMLTMLSGVDVDGTMSQQAIASNQMAIRGKSQESQDAAQKPVARSEMQSAARMALPQQRRDLEQA